MAETVPHLLDRDLDATYRREWTDHIAAEPGAAQQDTQAVLVFRVGQEWLALPAILLHTITDLATIHSLPHQAERIVRGLVNVRGELLICIALDAVIGASAAAGSDTGTLGGVSAQRMLVVTAPGGMLVFPVDEVYGVHRFEHSELRDVPSTLATAEPRFTTGLIPLHGRMIARLDEHALFDTIKRALA